MKTTNKKPNKVKKKLEGYVFYDDEKKEYIESFSFKITHNKNVVNIKKNAGRRSEEEQHTQTNNKPQFPSQIKANKVIKY